MKKLSARILSITLAAVLGLGLLSGCSSSSSTTTSSTTSTTTTTTTTTETAEAVEVISKYGYDLSEYASIDWPVMTLTTTAQQSETGSLSMMTRYMNDMISEASGGNITFIEYWNAELTAGTDIYEYVRDGIVDYGEVPSTYEYSPFFLYQMALTIPFTSPDFALNGEAFALVVDQYPEFTAANEASGVYVSAFRGIENYNMPVTDALSEDTFTMDWFNGARIAVGSTYFASWLEAMGSIPITGSNAATNYEHYMNGVIDGSFTSDSNICDYQYYETCKTIVEMDIGARASTLSCWNLDTWNSFSPEVQNAIQGIADLCVEEYTKVLNASIEGYESVIFNDNGLSQVVLTEEQKAQWCDAILADDTYNTMKAWIAEAEELGYDNASDMMASLLEAFESLGYEFPFDTSVAFD